MRSAATRETPSRSGDFGAIVVFAFRYAVGRKTYAPSLVAEFIKHHSDQLSRDDKNQIVAEIVHARDLGDDCDAEVWYELARWLIAARTPVLTR